VCTGFCPHLDLTVWEDGRVIVSGRERSHVSNKQAARFRNILRPFRPADDHSAVDPSAVIPNACPVKVEWIPYDGGSRSVACGNYFMLTDGEVGAHADTLFEAVMQALRSIHLNAYGHAAL
jgi:hypothetical protein